MTRKLLHLTLLTLALLLGVAGPTQALPTLAEETAGARRVDGFIPLWWDADKGRVLAEISRFEEDILYMVSLPTGVGSNDIGLDRGQLSDTRVVYFSRSGPKVLLVERNLAFRAVSDNPDERRAVSEAFARSVLAGFTVVAEERDDSGQAPTVALVDLTPLLTSDAYGVAARLAALDEGAYRVDAGRSAPDPEMLKSFPQNTLLESWVTLAGDKPGAQLRSVVPTATAVTVKTRHEFIQLPDENFPLRTYHPRSGYWSVPYLDYAAGLDEALRKHLIVRHRLEKKDPQAAVSEAVEPLVYYVDRGAPEPIRSALIEGASWWNQAFEAAGFRNAFQVEVLPEGVDPLDIRYNVIQWVHRSTRGWSYGWGIIDPRTGEIIKGHVSLGSLRVRQDMLIAQGLTAPFSDDGDGGTAAREMALARLRQLSAHEVGHTLGLAHNFFASAWGDASVMDYPHPNVKLNASGRVSLDNAYDVDIGEWDKAAINYGYRVFANPAQEPAGLKQILAAARQDGLRFVSDPEVRGPATAHAGAHLWDNGESVLERFSELRAVRRTALNGFSPAVIRPGEPLAKLEEALVPTYLLHRYQAEAVAKLIGGVDYDYVLRGDATDGVTVIPGDEQREALEALLGALAPEELRLPASLLPFLVPPSYGDGRSREYFSHRTSNHFDQAAPARALTQAITQMVLEPNRLQRVHQQTATDTGQLSLGELLEQYTERLILPVIQRDAGLIELETAWVALRELQRSAVSGGADPTGMAVRDRLTNLIGELRRTPQARQMASEITRFLEDPSMDGLPARETVPPGSPI
ncbi:MAG: zinc-dependent metalloprotease [Pseudomonadota bacterium]